jgi:hypothetical protein
MLGKKHENLPKRFWRVFKFIKGVRDNHPIKLDTVSESMISSILVRNEKNELTQPRDMVVKISRDFIKWYDGIFDNLLQRGYLEEEDRYIMSEYGGANFKVSEFSFYPKNKRKIMKMKSVLKNMLIRYVQRHYLEKELPKEKVKRVIYDALYVTKMREKLSDYLDFDDSYVPEKNITKESLRGVTVENFKEQMLERFSIPVKSIVPEEGLSVENMAYITFATYKVYHKNYRNCEKCRNYVCGDHMGFLDIARQLVTENNRDMPKRSARKLIKENERVFYSLVFDNEYIEKKIKVKRKVNEAKRIQKSLRGVKRR